jgi:leucyl-tRNA synthetase
MGNQYSVFHQPWPSYDESALTAKTVTLVIQVNGKVRDRMEIAAGLPNEDVEKLVKDNDKLTKFYEGKAIRKIIVIPDKLANVVVS